MHITIPLEPRTKKNHQQVFTTGAKPRVIASKQYLQYEKDCAPYMPKERELIGYPVNVKCEYYMKTRRKVDLANLQQATLDVVVKYKVLLDDNCRIVASMDGSRVFYDKDNPRTEIEIKVL